MTLIHQAQFGKENSPKVVPSYKLESSLGCGNNGIIRTEIKIIQKQKEKRENKRVRKKAKRGRAKERNMGIRNANESDFKFTSIHRATAQGFLFPLLIT